MYGDLLGSDTTINQPQVDPLLKCRVVVDPIYAGTEKFHINLKRFRIVWENPFVDIKLQLSKSIVNKLKSKLRKLGILNKTNSRKPLIPVNGKELSESISYAAELLEMDPERIKESVFLKLYSPVFVGLLGRRKLDIHMLVMTSAYALVLHDTGDLD